MNEKQIAEFRAILLAMQEDLQRQNQRGQAGQATVMLDQQAVGRLSRMDALQNQAMAQATQSRRDGALKRIAAAFSRMDQGEFGYCTDCGDTIDPKRLRLDPAVPRCIACTRG